MYAGLKYGATEGEAFAKTTIDFAQMVFEEALECGSEVKVCEWPSPIPLSKSVRALPFPQDIFPRRVVDFANTVAKSINCPIDYIAIPIISIAGAAIGAARSLGIKPEVSD